MYHFLTIANLNSSKGCFILLDACRHLAEWGEEFHLHVVGAETAEISAERFLQEIELRHLEAHVTYHGRQYGEDKEARFAEAQAFVHPTLDDCFPLVLLEAMQHGLPIISTPVGAIPDIVKEGKTGLLVAERDAELLAAAMRRFMQFPQWAEDMGLVGKFRYELSYTAAQFEQNLFKILKRVGK